MKSRVAVLVTAAILTLSAGVVPANAAVARGGQQANSTVAPHVGALPVQNIYQNVSTTYSPQVGGDWVQCNYAQVSNVAQTVGCSSSVTVAAQFTGSIATISLDEIGSLLHFDVQWSYSTTTTGSTSVTVPAGGSGPFYAGAEYQPVTTTNEWEQCQGICTPWVKQTNTVQKYVSPTFKYGGTL